MRREDFNVFDDSKAPFRRTNTLHDYACYYVHAETGEKTWMFCSSMNQYHAGETAPAENGIDYLLIDCEL